MEVASLYVVLVAGGDEVEVEVLNVPDVARRKVLFRDGGKVFFKAGEKPGARFLVPFKLSSWVCRWFIR